MLGRRCSIPVAAGSFAALKGCGGVACRMALNTPLCQVMFFGTNSDKKLGSRQSICKLKKYYKPPPQLVRKY
jgi:hypothetical protein